MINEEIDDVEFYHQDFTTASEWEVFIARMEEIIHEWKIQGVKNDDTQTITINNWNKKSENLCFAEDEFTLTQYRRFYLKKDEDIGPLSNLYNPEYDFLPYEGTNISEELLIEYWYGLHHFLILSTSNNTSINEETKIKVLLSSVNIALSNLGCDIPIFVQIREKWQRCYQGICETNGLRTNFEMVHLRKGPQHCKYLTGLLDMFKTKIASAISLNSVMVSVQFSYYLNNWLNSAWFQEYSTFENNIDQAIKKLRFGVSYDPINDLLLKTTWLHLPEHLVVDSENYSDFDPMQAPKWSVVITFNEKPICYLSECLSEFISLTSINSTLENILGDLIPSSNDDSINPLNLLTEPRIPTISSVIRKAAGRTKRKLSRTNLPIDEDTLATILYYLFPDAVENSQNLYNNQSTNKEINSENSFSNDNYLNFEIQGLCKGLKTCAVDSLVWRLSVVLSLAMSSLGGVKTVAYLWYEFVQEMRYRWDECIPIPGIASGFPDHRTCLLHQKLQMLNCCIERKKNREAALNPSQKTETSSEDESEDEFFDCLAEQDPNRKRFMWSKPVGRLSKHGNLRLLETGDQLYIPMTQEPAPKTEDQLEEDTDVLLKLGSDAQGSELRAKMMSASLLSDMESFKAANPEAILEDFIRWYSPRDWIEEEELNEWGQKKGHLSSRMQISDNTWVETWQSAKPVPAHRQRRLFDDTKEAEKVLHYLGSRNPTSIVSLLLPVLCHAVIYRLAEESEETLQIAPELLLSLKHIIKTVERLSRDSRSLIEKYEPVLLEASALELLISQIHSLLHKFNPSKSSNERVNNFVADLITGKEVTVEGGSQSFIGCRLLHMFTEAQKAAKLVSDILEEDYQSAHSQGQKLVFPQATKREFVMRVAAVRPAPYSTQSNQMLRAIFSKNDFRLAGAFTEDITFS